MTAIDIETTGLDPIDDKIVAIAVHSNGRTTVVDRYTHGQEGLRELVQSIQGPVVAHNIKFDAAFIRNDLGVELKEMKCTYIMSKVLQNGKDFDNSLVNCLYYYLGIKEDAHVDKKAMQKGFSIMRPLSPKEREYIIADVQNLLPLYERLNEMIVKGNFTRVLDIEEQLLPVLLDVERNGVRIDVPRLKQLVHRWKQCIKILLHRLDKEVNYLYDTHPDKPRPLFVAVNYNSPTEVTELFKVFCKNAPVRYDRANKEWRYSVEYDALNEFLSAHPDTVMRRFIEIFIQYKEYEKQRSTYGEAILKRVKDGYIHTTYKQIDTDTGRLSSSNPNLQNLGTFGAGATVRNCFLPDEGDLIVDVDMDAAEIRIAADKSQDPLLLDNILKGADMHSFLATKIFSLIAGEPVEISKSKEPIFIRGHRLVPGKLRDFSKTGHFARLYKGGHSRMKTIYAEYLFALAPADKHKEICEGIVRVLDESMPGLTRWANARIEEGKEKGFLREPKLGRIRYFSQDEYGSICNYLIQGTNGEAMKTALIEAHKYLKETGHGRILLTIHDQLVVSAHSHVAEVVKERMVEIMRDSIGKFLDSVPGGATGKITKMFDK